MTKIALSCMFVMMTTVGFAQEKQQEKADQLYSKYAYIDAIKIYERIAEKGYINQDILEKLGNSYFFNADYKNALKWYDQLFELSKNNQEVQLPDEFYYRYSQTLKSQERYSEANQMLDKFTQMVSGNDQRAKVYERNKNYLKEIEENSNRFELFPVSINSENSEYGTAFYGDSTVIITKSKKPGFFSSKADWTGDTYFDLYQTNKVGVDLQSESKFTEILNSKFNESSPVFTKDLKTIYFTRNDVKMDRKAETVILKIYKSTLNSNGQWSTPVALPFNSNDYNVAHPALSPDENYLYFASDMPGTLGKSDIFRVEIKEGGKKYGKPENLGKQINTEDRETFPFISKDGIMYFSSDGLPGLGGLDIFGVKLNPDGTFGRLQNIGRPGNSPDDDFAFVVNSDTHEGFLTSNRQGGKGKDDIYGFTENPPLAFDCSKIIKGIVKDIDTKEILTDVEVTLEDKDHNKLASMTNNSVGEFDFGRKTVDCDDQYAYVRAQKTDYSVAEERVNFVQGTDEVYAEIFLKTQRTAFKVGDNIAKFFNIEIIYFDFDKSNIRHDAAIDLAKVVEVMKEYPNMKIEIQSHTDSRGSDSYNLALSDRRAKSTLEWMVKEGISRDRLTAKGYGETQLVNGCSNDVPCSEEDHQLNRRSAFIIKEM